MQSTISTFPPYLSLSVWLPILFGVLILAVGRDSKTIIRSVNMALLITDKKEEVERLADTISARMGKHASDALDTCLAGTPDQIRERLHELKAAGASTLFIPTLFRPLDELRHDMDQFIEETGGVALSVFDGSGQAQMVGATGQNAAAAILADQEELYYDFLSGMFRRQTMPPGEAADA